MPNATSSPASETPPESLIWQIGAATLARFIINTSRRFAYPFAPALSRGLGTPLTAITSLIALNQVTGLLSPFFGPLSDRWGYRVMLLAGVGLMALGMLAGGLLPFYGVVLIALFLAGLGKSIFDPALQAYVGERVPYQRRGLVIGLIEFSWAGASLVGIPLAGLLIEQWSWRAPFLVLGGLGLLTGATLALLMPSDRAAQAPATTRPNLRRMWGLIRRRRAAWSALVFGFFIAMANDAIFVVYGAWLEQQFALGVAALGTATTVIGVAELSGETLTATLADRLGPKRAVSIGVVCSTLSYMLLPLIGQTLPLALVGLFLTFITFEFTIVTSFSLMTEILPEARATLLSGYLAATSLGRVAGALLGGPLWLGGGMLWSGGASALLSAVGLVFFWWGLRRWEA